MSSPRPDLERLSDLTRRYAKFSQDAAGLATIWGGSLFLFIAGLAWGRCMKVFEQSSAPGTPLAFLRFLVHGEHPLNKGIQILIILSPIIWYLGWRLLNIWSQRQFGRVSTQPEGTLTPAASLGIWAGLCLGALGYFAARPWLFGKPLDPLAYWGSLALLLVGPFLVWSGRKDLSSDGRSVLMMLAFAGAFLLQTGISERLIVLLVPYSGLAIYLMARGAIRLGSYFEVVHQLGTLRGEHDQT